VDCTRHPKPETVWPVRVREGAFGRNVPVRDLYLSPDHAVCINDVLVPVKLLINGFSITQVKRSHVAYYHVELPEHAVILAEGLTVESYLDTGDRANFDGEETIRLHPDFTTRLARDTTLAWETKAVAPLVLSGGELVAIRQLLARLPNLGPRVAIG
jgi:Hint domain